MSESQQARNKALHQRISELESERDRQVHRALGELAKAEARVADLERIICGNDLILRNTSELATHWRGRAAELEAQAQRAESRAQKAEGVIEIWKHEVTCRDAEIDGLRALFGEAKEAAR